MSVTVSIAGQIYSRWQSVRITRGLKQVASTFELEVPGELVPAIVPFQPCTLADDGEVLLTGYVTGCSIRVGARYSSTRIVGKSKTGDLVDSTLPFGGGFAVTSQFNGYTLDAIARAVAEPFGIEVVIGPGVNVGDVFPDATFQRTETAFSFLEHHARLRAVLLTDNGAGNLVLATAGTARAPTDLVMGAGGNVAEAQGTLNGERRFSEYHVLSQAGIKVTGADVLTNIEAVAYDGAVPRLRVSTVMAESASMPGDAQVRANWDRAHASGEAVRALLTVPEWRANGALWDINQLARVDVPRLALADTYLIGAVDFRLDREGKRTILSVAPPSAFQPEPAVSAGAGASPWDGIVPVAGP